MTSSDPTDQTISSADISEPQTETQEDIPVNQEVNAEDQAQELSEVDHLKEQLMRALADIENLRKRHAREKEEALQYGITKFARNLLPVADNLRRALETAEAFQENEDFKTIREGVEITEKELLSAFEKAKIEKISPEGEKFDHDYHQAIFEVEDERAEPGTVLQVMQAGYTISGRLLRPAMVGVAKKKA